MLEQYEGGGGNLEGSALALAGHMGSGSYSEDIQPSLPDFDFLPHQAYMRRPYRSDHPHDFRSQVRW